MDRASTKRLALVLGLLLAGGCLSPVREQVDAVVCDMAAHPLDLHPAPPREEARPMPPAQSRNFMEPPALSRAVLASPSDPDIQQAGYSQPPNLGKPSTPPDGRFQKSLQMPESLPGGNPELVLPGRDEPVRRAAAIKALFPELPRLEPLPAPQPGPFGHPLTLAELQQLAMARNPLIRQAAADVEAAKGAARQAGAYPNPKFGYESDNINSGGTAGFQGAYLEQLIKTAGKLKTAEASALMSMANAQLALRRAQTDVMAQVRAGYFSVLVAQYALRVHEGLQQHTENIYELFRRLAVSGVRPPYEAIEVRALTLTARATLTQSRNRYLSAWRQLAATLGDEHLPLTEVAGSAEMAVPLFHHDLALAYVLSSHTDILTARNTQQKGRYDLHQAQLTPVPDLDFRVVVQKDFTTPPFNIAENVQLGITLPLWDRNQGAIAQAQGTLLRATEEEHRVRLELATRLAEAFERYDSSRRLAEYYRERILPDYKRVFYLVVNLFAAQSEKGEYNLQFLDIINNQQLYVTAVATYLNSLAAQWQAVSDVASLLQIDELYLPVENQKPPEAAHQQELPCSHPCDPLPNSAVKEETLPMPRKAPSAK
jgi:cobalt-zinc-cadmium efflux system outer membrane protein